MSAALDAARAALRDEAAWVVGGAVRDRLMGRDVGDVDIVVPGDVRAAARHLAMQAGGPVFPLSDAYGAWRVIAPGRDWQVDLTPLRGERIEADLALRDFTVNAIAEPLDGGALVDPYDGAGDVRAQRLRMVDPSAFDDDPLRVLRLARFACELRLVPDEATVQAAAQRAGRLAAVAAERIFAELRRVIAAAEALEGFALMDRLGATEVVLPELAALRGVEQNRFHHLDVYDHTLAVVQAVIDLEADPAAVVGAEHAAAVAALLAAPYADDMTRGAALRVGALLHDAAKPQTRRLHDDGTVLGFPGHDERGAELARDVLARLRASERLRAYASGLARHHLRAGFLVHQRPLAPRVVFDYLEACGAIAVDVTLLSMADRLATRGDNAQDAIAAHLEVARELLGAALRREADGEPAPLVRGDELAAALGIAPGPQLGPLLREVAAARYAGEIATREDAIAHARAQLAPDRAG